MDKDWCLSVQVKERLNLEYVDGCLVFKQWVEQKIKKVNTKQLHPGFPKQVGEGNHTLKA